MVKLERGTLRLASKRRKRWPHTTVQVRRRRRLRWRSQLKTTEELQKEILRRVNRYIDSKGKKQ